MCRPLWILPLFIALAAQAQVTPQFREQEIDNQVGIGYGLAIADVDGDGKTDILLADKDSIVWYQNPEWKKHIIAEKLTEKDHVCIAARDTDGDGKAEIAVGAEWNPGDTETSGAVFYLQPPADRTQRWTPVQLTHEPTTHRMRWVRNRAGRYDLIVAPLHGRGNKNGEGAGVRILAYHKPEDVTRPWNTTLVHDSMHLTHNFEVVPGPAGEAESLLLGGREGIVRLTPGDSGWKQQWVTRHDSPDLQGVGEVRWGAFAGGQPYVAAIEPMHGNQVVIYTPPPEGPKDGLWQRRVLDDTLVDGHALACYDYLGLNNRQIAVGWRAHHKLGSRVGVKLYYTTKEDGHGWESYLVDDNTMACEDLMGADLDGDRDTDLIAAGRRSQNLKIYWNLRQ
ncbi:VCBS repeat protein [Prosthecobacter fusiformis]|uniref:VCBS repeat protein n=1 Tax=Prosthecobacter fusiformis TaxID=48464 RepID=A0A4V3FI97_9BACT|nr:FG-GAP and VCBS repeat-containing protein [Prosthecobacter fusiformis]TDU81633.1 VCBS repeat protein [Prosthecobacter fusiformis]